MKPWLGSVDSYISLHTRNANSLGTDKFEQRSNIMFVGSF